MAILSAIAAFDAFDPDNDPYGERDFGALTVEGERIFFKIDYLDRGLTGDSPDPADADCHGAGADGDGGGEY